MEEEDGGGEGQEEEEEEVKRRTRGARCRALRHTAGSGTTSKIDERVREDGGWG